MGNPPSEQLAPPPGGPAIKAGARTYWQRMSTALAGTGLLAPREIWRAAFAHLRSFASRTQAPPPKEQAPDRVVYGLSQPLLGLRLLVSDPELLREALVPAAWLGAFCAVVAAPVPSVVFAKHYARLAAMVRWRLGFGACGPREYSMAVSLKRAIEQAIVVAIGVLPFAVIWKVLPGLGVLVSNAVILAWGVHWVVVDAFDDARVLLPGETIRSAEA